MQSVVILYRSHDEDLLALYETVGLREFGRLLKESLRILSRPGYKPKHKPPTELIPFTGEKDSIRLKLNVTAEKDADIEELLSHVKNRRLGAFCKMALRFYIGPQNVLASMLDISLTPVLSYIPTGHIVASVQTAKPVRQKRTKKDNIAAPDIDKEQEPETEPITYIDTDNDQSNTNDTIVTALPMQMIPAGDLNMTMGDTVVMTGANEEDEDDILALLENLMD